MAQLVKNSVYEYFTIVDETNYEQFWLTAISSG